ncbi:PfkB family carbohydrate kinase, partial [Staphylococcus aureus]|uniref:carbohydrate kinase family protein n=1 Tax=Staphylococcus aureus TaxID=1280 RepID=UPI001E407778
HEDWVGPVRERLLALARSVDVFVPSAEELSELTGCDDPADGLAVLAADGLQRAVVKAGARGAYVLHDGHVWHVPATTGPVDD